MDYIHIQFYTMTLKPAIDTDKTDGYSVDDNLEPFKYNHTHERRSGFTNIIVYMCIYIYIYIYIYVM